MAHLRRTAQAERASHRVISIPPDGRRVVDPVSIIGSESARKHLAEVAKVRPPEDDKSESSTR